MLKRTGAVALGMSTLAFGALAGQSRVPVNSPIPIPLADGGRRQPALERQYEQAAGPGHDFIIYRWEGPAEPVVRFYIQRMGAERDGDLDSTAVRPGGTSNLVYHLTFWNFEDQCIDSLPPGAVCTHFRRAKDLKRGLNNRLPMAPGAWVKHCTFRWFSKDDQGAMTKWTVDVFDSGMTPDWRHYEPTVDLIVESEPVKAPAPASNPGPS